LKEIGSLKVGLVGVTAAAEHATPSPVDAVKAGVDSLKKQGAQVVIALAALGRGDAKRLADVVPELTAIVVGSPGGGGEVNTPAAPPERVGDVLVLQTGN